MKKSIAIIGDSNVKPDIIRSIFSSNNMSGYDIEMHLDYAKLKKLNYERFKYNDKYVYIFVGPILHSVNYKHDSPSIITEMEMDNGYPDVVRLEANNSLKITNSSIKRAIETIKERNEYNESVIVNKY